MTKEEAIKEIELNKDIEGRFIIYENEVWKIEHLYPHHLNNDNYAVYLRISLNNDNVEFGIEFTSKEDLQFVPS